MKPSETSNQAFQEMRFHPHIGHITSKTTKGQFPPHNIFESQELPMMTFSTKQPPQEGMINCPNPDSPRGQGQKVNPQLLRIPQQYLQPMPQPPRIVGFVQLQTLQSYAPSQKTLAMPHMQGLATGPVYQSHVATEPIQSQVGDRLEKRMLGNPNTRVGFEMSGMMLKSENGVRSMIQHLQFSQNDAKGNEPYPQISESQWWRDKYEEQKQLFQGVRAQYLTEFQTTFNHNQVLQQENLTLRNSLDKLGEELQQSLEENENLKQQLNAAGQKISDNQLKLQLEERGMLIGLLKKENEQLKLQAQHCEQLSVQVQQLQESNSILKMELEQRDAQITQLKRVQPSSPFSHSRAQSVDNNRLLDLEMQNGRMISEIAARDEAHEQELKLSTLKFTELAQRFQSTITEKDHAIRLLQEKAAILESDLNKKDSLLRNLRDELVEIERKKGHSPVHSTLHTPSPHQSTSGSAINPPMERAERLDKDESKRQNDNLRKHLFDKEREITILQQRQEELKELLQEAGSIGTRRKNQVQNLRRQLGECEDHLAQLQRLKESLAKKNKEITEMRQILLQKQQHSGQYQVLSKQNEKLREITLKKNNELSELLERLYDAQRKIRQQEGYNPKIEALQEQVDALSSHLRAQQSEIQRLGTNLQHAKECVLQAELQVEKERVRQAQLQNLLNEDQGQIEDLHEEISKGEQRYQLMERELQSLVSKMFQRQKQVEQLKQIDLKSRSQLGVLQKELTNRNIELQTATKERKQMQMFKAKSFRQAEQIEIKQSQQINRKNQDLQIAASRCKELEVTVRLQKQKLAKIEPEVEVYREKYMKHHNCQKTIEELTEKVAKYQRKILSSPYARHLFQNYPLPTTRVFENQLIYKLKHENQSLKTNIKRVQSPIAMSPVAEAEDVRLRLSQFPPNWQSAVQEQKRLVKIQSQRSINREMEKSKQVSQDFTNEDQSHTFSLQNLQNLYSEQVSYYKKQNEELEKRNNLLIKINQELKQSLQHLSANKNHELKQFYNLQLKHEKEKACKLQKQLSCSKVQAQKLENQVIELKYKSRMIDSPKNVSYNFGLKEMVSNLSP